MSELKWSALANQHAMVTVASKSSLIFLYAKSHLIRNYIQHQILALILGGVVSTIGQFYLWPIGTYSLLLGVLVFIIEYPRSGKSSRKQSVKERRWQFILAEQFTKLGFAYSNYFPRFLVYSALSIPCFFTLSTLIPAFNLLITALLYLFSNFKKEKWLVIEKKTQYAPGTVIKHPDRPPPRNISDL